MCGPQNRRSWSFGSEGVAYIADVDVHDQPSKASTLPMDHGWVALSWLKLISSPRLIPSGGGLLFRGHARFTCRYTWHMHDVGPTCVLLSTQNWVRILCSQKQGSPKCGLTSWFSESSSWIFLQRIFKFYILDRQ